MSLATGLTADGTWRYDTGVKRFLYEERGVAELWLVDIEGHRVLVHQRSSSESPTFDEAVELPGGATLTSPLPPGFAVAVASLLDT